MAITDSTIDTELFIAVRTILVSASLSTTSGTTVTAAQIAASYNDKELSRPQVIIYPISDNEVKDKFGSNYGKRFLNIDIDCYANNTLKVDQLSQQIKSALSENVIDGVDLIGITTDYAFQQPGNNKYHLKNLTFTYQRE